MTTTQFLAQTDLAVPVANDVAAGALRASVHHIPAVSAIVASRNGNTETMIFVEEGIIELSINGMEGYLSQGEFARVAPGAHFAFRNKNEAAARVLSVPVLRTERTLRVIEGSANAA